MQKRLLLILAMAIGFSFVIDVKAQEDTSPLWLTSDSDGGYTLHRADGDSIELFGGEELTGRNEQTLKVSPTGAHIAIVTINFYYSETQNTTPENERQMWLDVFRTLDGKHIYHAALFGNDIYLPTLNEDYNNGVNGTLGEVSFSPDGRYLAWVSPSAPDEESYGDGRLMLLDLSSNLLREIPDESGAPTDFNWSPDSRHLHYRSVFSFSTGGGYDSMNSQSFLVETASGMVDTLSLGGDREIIGWLDNENLAFTDFINITEIFSGIMRYDIRTQSETEIVPRSQRFIAQSPRIEVSSGKIVFRIENLREPEGLDDGVYLLDWQSGELSLLENQQYDMFENWVLGTTEVVLTDYALEDWDAAVVSPRADYAFVRDAETSYLLNYQTGETIELAGLPESFSFRWSVTGANFLIYDDETIWLGSLDGNLQAISNQETETIRALVYPLMSSNAPVNCADMAVSRLSYEQEAQVIAGTGANNLRTMPYRSADLIDVIPESTPFEVLGGAWCSEGIVWWYVSYGGQVGWTAESVDGSYYLEAVN